MCFIFFYQWFSHVHLRMDASVFPNCCANGNFVNVINLQSEAWAKHTFFCSNNSTEKNFRHCRVKNSKRTKQQDNRTPTHLTPEPLPLMCSGSALVRNTKQACSRCAVNVLPAFVLNQILISPTWRDSLQHLSLSAKHNEMWLVIMAESWTMISAGWRTQVQRARSPFSSSD